MRRIEGSNPRPAHQLRVCDSHRTPGPFVRAVFQQAAHLCDSCVVLSKDVARDAEQMDLVLGRPWPWRTYHLVKLHHDSAADEPFDGEAMGRAMAAVLNNTADRPQFESTGKAEAHACPAGRQISEESECLAAAERAAKSAGLQILGIQTVDAGAESDVPSGCSYSHRTMMAVFNEDPAGTDNRTREYQILCAPAQKIAAQKIEIHDDDDLIDTDGKSSWL